MDELQGFLSKMDAQLPTGGVEVDLIQFSIVMVTAVIFGLLLKVLYNLYYCDNEPQDGSLSRSLVLITPALTATFWMIQSSLTLSLGLLGSMSFVRFRTPIKRPEDIAFIVIALGVSIALAIGTIGVAAILVGILFIYTVFRNNSFFSFSAAEFAVITFDTTKDIETSKIMEKLKKLNIKSEFVSSRTYDGRTSYVFNASKIGKSAHDRIKSCLMNFDDQAHINIFFPNERLGV